MSSNIKISVNELLSGTVQLASPPEVFLKINEAINSPSHTMGDIALIIEHDPGLSARLLKIVNSPFYGFPSRINSVKQAVGIVGFRDLRDLVVATLVIDRFSNMASGLISMRQFWMNSVKRALIARMLAQKSKFSAQLCDVFLSGLLHEIGLLVVYQRLPELARAACLQARVENVSEEEAQRRIFGINHYEVGAELSRRWRLPDAVRVAMESHEFHEQAKEFAIETVIVNIANDLSRVDVNNREEIQALLNQTTKQWEIAGTSQDDWDDLLSNVESMLVDIFKLFYQE